MAIEAPTVSEVVLKLQQSNSVEEGWTVMAYYLNHQLSSPSKPQTAYGLVVPCGSYKTEEEALTICDFLSASTGAAKMVVCRNKMPFPLRLVSDSSISYPCRQGADIEEIQNSISEARRRNKDIEARHQKEIEDRKDPNSLASFINSIYRYAAAAEGLKSLEQERLTLENSRDDASNQILQYLKANPNFEVLWELQASQLLEERGEIEIFRTMKRHFENLQHQR